MRRIVPTVLAALFAGCGGGKETPLQDAAPARAEPETPVAPGRAAGGGAAAKDRELATFGAGCFWCVEAVLERLDGVIDVASGYMGGTVTRPTYEQVCSGGTGHAEVVQVTFDPRRITYERLLDRFWKLHDPTTLNRQGNDAGTQYRSVIFYHSEAQREAAQRSRRALAEAKVHGKPIVTEIVAAGAFHEAEGYHQDYYRLNRAAPYCRSVIAPKLDQLGLEE